MPRQQVTIKPSYSFCLLFPDENRNGDHQRADGTEDEE